MTATKASWAGQDWSRLKKISRDWDYGAPPYSTMRWCLHVLAHARDNYHGACLRGLDNQTVSTPAEQARKLFCCLTQCTEHFPATLAEHCCAEEFNLPSQLAGRWRGCESDNLGNVTTCYNSRLYSSGRLLALISCRQLMDGNCVNS